MKRIISIAGFLILFLSPFLVMAETKDISDYDGNEWRTWIDSQRVFFISGFLAGASYVIEENTPSFGRYMGKDYDERKAEIAYFEYEGFVDLKNLYLGKKIDKTKEMAKPDMAPAPIAPEARKQRYSIDEVSLLLEREYRRCQEWLPHYSIIGITSGQILDGLNLFYEDFRNRQIKLRDAIYVIRKQILGASKEETEAITEWLRTPDRPYDKLRYKDKEGNIRHADFP